MRVCGLRVNPLRVGGGLESSLGALSHIRFAGLLRVCCGFAAGLRSACRTAVTPQSRCRASVLEAQTPFRPPSPAFPPPLPQSECRPSLDSARVRAGPRAGQAARGRSGDAKAALGLRVCCGFGVPGPLPLPPVPSEPAPPPYPRASLPDFPIAGLLRVCCGLEAAGCNPQLAPPPQILLRVAGWSCGFVAGSAG